MIIAQANNSNNVNEKNECWILADKYLSKATSDFPDNFALFNTWASVMLMWASSSELEDKANLVAKAEELCIRSNEIDPKGLSGLYNLACCAAFHSDSNKCVELLMQCYENGNLPSLSHIEQDGDLTPVRDSPAFKNFLEKVRANKIAVS